MNMKKNEHFYFKFSLVLGKYQKVKFGPNIGSKSKFVIVGRTLVLSTNQSVGRSVGQLVSQSVRQSASQLASLFNQLTLVLPVSNGSMLQFKLSKNIKKLGERSKLDFT